MFEDCLTDTANLSSLELCIASWQIEITQSPALCPDYSDYSPFYTYSPMCVHGEISNEINAFNTKNSSVVERLQQQSSKEQRARFIKRKFLRGTKEGGKRLADWCIHTRRFVFKVRRRGHVPSWWNNKLLTEFYHSTAENYACK